MDRLKMENNICCSNDQMNGGDYFRRQRNNNGLNWTNEKHSDFLSLMEASFVRTMFDKSCTNTNDVNHVHRNKKATTATTTTATSNSKNTRLDRFVPDIAESTLDSHKRKNSIPVRVSDTSTNLNITQRQKVRAHPYKISHDQVVPQLENKAGDKGDRAENDYDKNGGL